MPEYSVTTPNFSYILQVSEKHTPFHTIEFLVGDAHSPCLSASIFLPGIDERFADIVEIATLHKIDALERCALEWNETKSFGTELLYSFLHILSANFSHIHTIKLSDASYIPCNRGENDTLDLLTYSIALYGKSWYEQKAGTYLSIPKIQTQYEKDIQHYMNPLTKTNTPFNDVFGKILSNTYAREFVGNDIPLYESLYNQSSTFSEFFQKLSKRVPVKDKCTFFKGWLESFLGERVHVGRNWLIDLQSNEILQNIHAKPMVKIIDLHIQRS